ncbi:hypothetical protein WISP_131730 [Willisornis vidua]|uniref:G-protein coupled receptors family 1 profile domain-containing protein n=1 Tax=Willisornis vidua TaxID=1566151 RepID=A0ABQ9CPI1_9PASS|nr:hypothetical protein WISP_131730 [Willisornis vidua]
MMSPCVTKAESYASHYTVNQNEFSKATKWWVDHNLEEKNSISSRERKKEQQKSSVLGVKGVKLLLASERSCLGNFNSHLISGNLKLPNDDGAFACKMVPFVQSTAIVTEILTMTCIAVERHQGIVHPLKMKWQYTNKRAFTMLGNFEKEYDDVTVKMTFAIVQLIGFFNSICNPIVYAFMNENFKKNFLSAICFCIVKENASPARQVGNSGITMRRQKPSVSQRDALDSEGARREAFSDGNIEVKFCDQPAAKRNLRRHLVLFSSELTVLGNGQ